MYRGSNRFSQPGAFARSSWGWCGSADGPTAEEKMEHARRLIHRLLNDGDHCAHVMNWVERQFDDVPF